MDKLPIRDEARKAARVLLRCNGWDLSQWSNDLLPDDDAMEGLRMIAQLDDQAGTKEGG